MAGPDDAPPQDLPRGAAPGDEGTPPPAERRQAARTWGAAEASYRVARKVAVAVVGTTVVLVGLALTVLPGPAMLVIPIGLAILGLEFAWARRWLRHLRDTSREALDRVRGRGSAGGDGGGDETRSGRADPEA